MRRHSVVARLGPSDKSRVPVQRKGSVVTDIHFIDGNKRLGFGLGKLIGELVNRGIVPTDAGIDLAILGAVVTAADTRISRTTESQDSWTREIDLYVPVADPVLWESAAPLLERTLNFLTGDRWRVFFRKRHKDYLNLISEQDDLVENECTSVCLFSGGLDSFVGAIDLLKAGEKPLFVSHYWDISTSSQTVCADILGKAYGDFSPRHVRAHIGFPDDLVLGSEPEKTQRGRSFLFFAMAATAASGLGGAKKIYVPENGLISLNVPLDPLRVGAWSTRTTHPFYMARWQELLHHLGITVDLDNPYRFKTKGEMMSDCANKKLLKKSVAETISCSSVAKARWAGLSPGHCGYCVPCLIRRAAIGKAFKWDSTQYTLADLSARTINAKAAEGEHIRSFQMMAKRLAKSPSLASILIHKSGPLSDYSAADVGNYAGVFSRGIKEVDRITKKAVVRPL